MKEYKSKRLMIFYYGESTSTFIYLAAKSCQKIKKKKKNKYVPFWSVTSCFHSNHCVHMYEWIYLCINVMRFIRMLLKCIPFFIFKIQMSKKKKKATH